MNPLDQFTKMFSKSVFFIALLGAVTASPLVHFKPHQGYLLPLFDNRLETTREAAYGEIPWQVSIQWGWLFGYSHFCSGAILTSSWIVTSGKCGLSVPTYGDLVIKAGKLNLKQKESTEQVAHPSKIIVHPSYNGNIGLYDIALIKLEKPLILNGWVKAINITNTTIPLTGNATLSGWGSTSRTSVPSITNRLQVSVVPLINYSTCMTSVYQLTGSNPLNSVYTICTGTFDNGYPQQISDAGSPLVITNSTTKLPQLAGITSWGILPTVTAGAPLIYTSIPALSSWINATMVTN